MKTMFHLAVLCLLFSSCHKDINEVPEVQHRVQNRSSKTVKATLLLQNGSTFQQYVVKANGTALTDSSLTVKLHFSEKDSSIFICKNIKLEEPDSNLRLETLLPNLLYTNKNVCTASPFSDTTIKMSVQSGNIFLYPNGFIAEEQDGI